MVDKKISELAPASALTGAEVLPVVQEGVTVKAAVSALSAPFAPLSFAIENAENGDGIAFDAMDGGAMYGFRIGSRAFVEGWVAVTFSTSASPSFPKVLTFDLPNGSGNGSSGQVSGHAETASAGKPKANQVPITGVIVPPASPGDPARIWLYVPSDMPNGTGALYFHAVYEYVPPP